MSKVTVIDISCWNNVTDFDRLKKSGIDSVIIRSGYGREETQKDTKFEEFYKNAKENGLKIGSYWYSYADSVADAEKEAKACLECIKNKNFELPVFYDLEDSSQVRLGKATLTKIAEKFCEIITSNGFKAGIYANLNWFNNYLDYNYLKSKYSIWLAQYYTENSLQCDIWQNSDSGKISGVVGNVDTNIILNSDFNKSQSSEQKQSVSANVTPAQIPDVFYRVQCGGKWLPAVKNLTDFAGIKGQAITGIAIKPSQGSVKYQVHILGGDWLPEVSGFNISDHNNGYAGNGKAIDAVRIYYETPKELAEKLGKYLKAKYRVSAINKDYFDFQYDNEKSNKMDGYAGAFGCAIDRLQIILE